LRHDLYALGGLKAGSAASFTKARREKTRHERGMYGHPGGESCWSTRLWDPVATNVRSF
jgi:hypothetical protein